METSLSDIRPFWAPAALFAACLLVALLAPAATVLLGHLLPDKIGWAAFSAHAYLFPVEALRSPDLPSGIQPGPNFRNELGIMPIAIVWIVVTLLFGWLARGLKIWATLALAVLTIAIVAVAIQAALRGFGFRLNPTFL